MEKASKKTTRRTFIRRISGTIAATSIGVAGWSNISLKNIANSDLMVFSEGQIGSLKIKNRFIRAAASKGIYSSGKPTNEYLRMYASYATGGVGLVLTGGMAVAPTSMGLIRVYDDQYIPELEKIVNAVHSTNETCKIMAQLWHNENAGPSGISWSGGGVKTLTVDEIKDRIGKFSEAIRRIRDAGFDGTELNAHYTYFLSSFLSPITNKRTDEYGGSLENRVRIVKEIVEQAHAKVGSEFPIMIKVNCNDSDDPELQSEDGINIENFHLLAAELEKAGVDAIELSGNTLLRKDITPDEESYFSEYSEKLDVSIPVITTGGNRTLDHLEEIIHRDKVDFFGLARPLIREPNLPKRWLEGDSTKSTCISCNGCVGGNSPLQCVWTEGIGHHSSSALRIFPNPVKDILHIDVPEGLRGDLEVVVTNLNGIEISRTFGRIQQLDLSSLSKGAYLITIRSEGLEATKQIIKF